MNGSRTVILLVVAASVAVSARPALPEDGAYELTGPGYRAALQEGDGAILSVRRPGTARAMLRTGDNGLWHARFRDGGELSAADFRAASADHRLTWTKAPDTSTLRMSFESPRMDVLVTATANASGLDLWAELAPRADAVLEFSLPARLRFEPDRLQRFISPIVPHLGVGMALNRSFFLAQDSANPTGWSVTERGPRGYLALLGEGPTMHDWDAPALPIRVTESGQAWFGPELSQRLAAASARVNRAFLRAQVDLVLLDSDAGPYLAAARLGGKGHLWRVGGRVEEGEAADTLSAVAAVIDRLAASPGPRGRLGLVAMRNGPTRGDGCAVTLDAWRTTIRRTTAARGLQFEELDTLETLAAAAGTDGFLAILNPYGESLPVPRGSSIVEAVELIRRYVRAGGNWFEVGGYSFYSTLRPVEHLRFDGQYPPLFADFFHLDTGEGAASVFRVQPRTWRPWEGQGNHDAIFVPGRMSLGGDERGGWCERAFGTFVAAGQRWTTPKVRIEIDRDPEDSLRLYCQENRITRTLDEKLPAPLRPAFRQAVLVKYNGPARELIAGLDKLPVPTLIHFTDYLKGGFDKEYPDHLPPSPRFGTPEEMRALFDRAHALGHLVMPYTNPTWWCDHPRGPTFLRAGESPLLRRLDGGLSHERYSDNDGYTTCLWHPDVQAVNRETVRQFTADYPVDILFQDQCGARTWQYDTNPASPTPYAYAEGMISMVEEDSQRKPLGTEDGFDRILNSQVQLCGFTFGLVPGRNPSWARSLKSIYPPSTWQLYPLAQHIAHDKAAMLHHDLGKFVVDRPTLTWTLGLGFAMSYVVRARDLESTEHREWLRWLDRIQKSVCARYVGEPVRGFKHEQPAEASVDDGVIRAAYGEVGVFANLGPEPKLENHRVVAGFGFLAQAPGMVAANLRSLGGLEFGDEGVSFVSEAGEAGIDLWILAAAGAEVAVLIPGGDKRPLRLTIEGQPADHTRPVDDVVRFRLPLAPGKGRPAEKRLWHARLHAGR